MPSPSTVEGLLWVQHCARHWGSHTHSRCFKKTLATACSVECSDSAHDADESLGSLQGGASTQPVTPGPAAWRTTGNRPHSAACPCSGSCPYLAARQGIREGIFVYFRNSKVQVITEHLPCARNCDGFSTAGTQFDSHKVVSVIQVLSCHTS